jgi:hypothetical protein
MMLLDTIQLRTSKNKIKQLTHTFKIMNITQLKQHIRPSIENEYYIDLSSQLIQAPNGLVEYNQLIRTNVLDLPGIYMWEIPTTEEVIYIGMAGKIKQTGQLVNHSVRKRLMASRGKDPETKRDILTNTYIKNIFTHETIDSLHIHVVHLIPNAVPAFIEAHLLNSYFQQNNLLPRYNHSF